VLAVAVVVGGPGLGFVAEVCGVIPEALDPVLIGLEVYTGMPAILMNVCKFLGFNIVVLNELSNICLFFISLEA
jgi:hypothetical protein